METVLVLALLALVVVGLAYLGNYFQEASSTEPLGKVKEDLLCSLHIWKEAVFLHKDNKAEFDADPSKFVKKTTHYCSKCGYAPSLERMVKPKFLEFLNEQQKLLEENEQRRQDIDYLKQMWLDEFFKHNDMTISEQKLVYKGYNHYDLFVDNLPALVKARELERIVKNLVNEIGPDQTKN